MKKIPTLFMRNHETDHLVRNEVTPGCEWVLAGEGKATRKFDGVCCMVMGGGFYKRYEVKSGKEPPVGFEPADAVDELTGKQPGWVPVGDGPDDRWLLEAFNNPESAFEDGTYELVGPKINGNPERELVHRLARHGVELVDAPRDFDGLKEWLRTAGIEGVVWHHLDGRMAKLKARDFWRKRDLTPT